MWDDIEVGDAVELVDPTWLRTFPKLAGIHVVVEHNGYKWRGGDGESHNCNYCWRKVEQGPW